MSTPNPNIDHLDPANWWPFYHMETDRRALPARSLLALSLDLEAWTHEGPETPAPGHDPWNWITLADVHVVTHEILLQHPGNSEELVPPDAWVYVAQVDFDAHRDWMNAALAAAYNGLWYHHQAGRISRAAFDTRAQALRDYRHSLNLPPE